MMTMIKKMKRSTVLTLALIMGLSLSGCSSPEKVDEIISIRQESETDETLDMGDEFCETASASEDGTVSLDEPVNEDESNTDINMSDTLSGTGESGNSSNTTNSQNSLNGSNITNSQNGSNNTGMQNSSNNSGTGNASYSSSTKVEQSTCSHVWKEATCTEPKKCIKCGMNGTFSELGHSFTIEATCEKPRQCSRCGLTDGKPLEHLWMPATTTEPKTCFHCGKTEGEPLTPHTHEWIAATCTDSKVCKVCREHEGEPLGHDYKWDVIQEAKPGIDGYKAYVCTRCGCYDLSWGMETIPALADGQETPWVYSNNGTHREKTLYDGRVIKEDLYTLGNVSQWGWFDDEAASAMNEAVNYMLSNVSGWQTFNIDISYYEDAKDEAFAYSYSKSSSSAYHSSHGGAPNVDDNKRYITLMDGYGNSNYIACFVRDSYQGNEDWVYGKYWKSYFGTYYASGNY